MVVDLLERVGDLSRIVLEQREEIARLKGLKGRPEIKPPVRPSGMEQASLPPGSRPPKRRGGGPKTATRTVHEDRVIEASVPAGSRFKGYEDFVVQDLVLRAHVTRYRRERWITPDGQSMIAPLPAGVGGHHFGPELRRFILAQYHESQVTAPRLLAQLRSIGIDMSKRQLVRLLIGGQDRFVDEAREVLRAGLATARWISVDDTGARHKGRNGVCTQIGNAFFTSFRTTRSKSRLNFLDCLRAGHADYVINAEALAYMSERGLPGPVIARLAAHPRRFADEAAFLAHLASLGITDLTVTPDPICIATEGALFGSVKDHGFLNNTVVISDDAGQFNVGHHALCWIHAERLVHKLEAFTETGRKAKETVRCLIWWLYHDLIAYQKDPTSRRKAELKARFDRIFKRRTGFVTLDRLLKRLLANKPELLVALDRPEIPLHTNGSENDIRCYVTKRKISGGTRSDTGRDCRDAFLSLVKTCKKLGITFWDYLGARIAVPNQLTIENLPEIIRSRAITA